LIRDFETLTILKKWEKMGRGQLYLCGRKFFLGNPRSFTKPADEQRYVGLCIQGSSPFLCDRAMDAKGHPREWYAL